MKILFKAKYQQIVILSVILVIHQIRLNVYHVDWDIFIITKHLIVFVMDGLILLIYANVSFLNYYYLLV